MTQEDEAMAPLDTDEIDGAGAAAGLAPMEDDTEDHQQVAEPTLELEAYISAYEGALKVRRLQHIARHCPSLAVEALRLANAELKRSANVKAREEIAREYVAACQAAGQPEPTDIPTAFELREQEKQLTVEHERLEQALKHSKTMMVQETIRINYVELGDHYFEISDYNRARRSYLRARDHCSNPQHIIKVFLSFVRVSLEMNEWDAVLTHLSKARSTPDFGKDEKAQGYANCYASLAYLAKREYKSAARQLLEIAFTEDNSNLQVLSARDIAIYGGLLSLASFTRDELRRHVSNNINFKNFLDLVPDVRELLRCFQQSDYRRSLELLEKLKNDLLLDYYLFPHIKRIFANIRERAMSQYFSPFLSVDMHQMAQAFATDIRTLENELSRLIVSGTIQARIDSDKKILYARQANQRVATFSGISKLASRYERQLEALLLRAHLVQNKVYTQDPNSWTMQGGSTAESSLFSLLA